MEIRFEKQVFKPYEGCPPSAPLAALCGRNGGRMKLRKILPIVICAVILITVFTGCSKETEDASPEETPTQMLEPTPSEPVVDTDPEPAQSHGIDFDAAFAAFAPDTIMMNVGDYTIKWAELYFYIRNNINGILQYGDIHDWSDIVYEDMTYADLVLNYSIESAMMYKAVEFGVDLYGVTLSADVIDVINASFENNAMQFGGEEEFLKILWEYDGISSRELFDYMVSINHLVNALLVEMYGENGELLSDEDVAEYTMFDGYLMAKHILRMKTEEDEDTALTEAEEILAQLEGYEGDDFESFFDELMREHTDDSEALVTHPNGYLFLSDDMVPEFYSACAALEIGEFSSIVETSYGYHIIYRKPVDFDEIPIYYYQQYVYGAISQDEYSKMILRNTTALSMFDSELYGWMNSLNVEYTDAYESMEFAKVFDVGEY